MSLSLSRRRRRAILSCELDTEVPPSAEGKTRVYNGVLTPQARTAHQPIQASKAQNSPISIKIAASTDTSGIRQAPARTKTTAILPRATRPLLSMFGFIQGRREVAAGK